LNVLAIGAHPEDIVIGCGGSLVKATRNGHNIYALALTLELFSHDPGQRKDQFMQFAKRIGAKDARVCNFKDNSLCFVTDKLINVIENFADEVSPDIIFTHSLRDIQSDHRAVATATIEGARFYSNILSYEVPHSKNFDPLIFNDISDAIEEKISLAKLFPSGLDTLSLDPSGIKSISRYRAIQCGPRSSITNVEAFEALKMYLDKEFKLTKAPFQKPEAKYLTAPAQRPAREITQSA